MLNSANRDLHGETSLDTEKHSEDEWMEGMESYYVDDNELWVWKVLTL